MDIYKATNNITEESYIGYAVDGLEDRKCDHKRAANRGDSVYFHRAISKYGLDNFRWIILEQGVFDFEILKKLAIYWIKEFGTKRPNGYNLTDGGDGTLGYKQSKEHRKKLSEAHKGKKLSEETRKKMSEAKKNMSDETKRKIGEASKGRNSFSRLKTPEAIENWRKSYKKYKQTEETRKKRINTMTGKKRKV